MQGEGEEEAKSVSVLEEEGGMRRMRVEGGFGMHFSMSHLDSGGGFL